MSLLALCLVVAITDGDTLKARCASADGSYEQRVVRNAAIDAPERAQPFGQRARQALADLCFQKDATLEPTDVDRYGRTVANVACQDKDVASYMVSGGYAWVFDRYASNHKHLYPLQRAAQSRRFGLWVDLDSAKPPVAPWQWRRQNLSAAY